MKLHTRRFIRLENKGQPQDTVNGDGQIRDHILMIAKWLADIHMGSRIVITLARTEAELSPRGGTPDSDMLSELNALLASVPVGEHESSKTEQRETLCADSSCDYSTPHIQGREGCRFADYSTRGPTHIREIP